jgi:hypothetical protein
VAKSPTLLLNGVLCTTSALKEKLGFAAHRAASGLDDNRNSATQVAENCLIDSYLLAKSWWKLRVTLES